MMRTSSAGLRRRPCRACTASFPLRPLTRPRPFLRPDQVMQEVSGFLKMLNEVYGIFGLDYELALSTRPEKYLGEIETWNKAESALTEALNGTGREWKVRFPCCRCRFACPCCRPGPPGSPRFDSACLQENPEDGAFYGPKIDIAVLDALKRRFQCATVQLDFQLPIRFDLTYMTEETGGQNPDENVLS